MSRITYFMIVLGIFVILMSLLLSAGIVGSLEHMNGINSMNKVVISSKSSSDGNTFILSDIEAFKKKLKTEEVAYAASNDSKAGYGNRFSDVRIDGVNSRYKNFTDLNMKFGSFFTSKAEKECSYVAIISSTLAWELYNKQNAIGMDILLFNRKFKVIGVYDKHGMLDKIGNANGNIIENKTDTGLTHVYIPLNTLLDIDSKQRIKYVQVKLPEDNIVGEGEEYTGTALMSIGKNPDRFAIIDFQKERDLVGQKHRLLMFIPGFLAILIVLKYLIGQVADMIKSFRKLLLEYYFWETLKISYSIIVIFAVKAVVCFLLIFVVWKVISFKLYISPEYIADELIDIQYYKDLFINKTREMNLDIGYTPDIAVLQLAETNKITQGLMLLGFVLGILPLYLGVKLLVQNGISVRKAGLLFAGCTLVTLVVSSIGCLYLGIENRIDLRYVFTIWIYLLCIGGCEKHSHSFLRAAREAKRAV